ncbi:hypothetical protein [Methanorbis rubei]|uniref:Uncharacterized protein n=1 Tax=Methanorbis rubei TaxID=3028300 RepID=A0AAE4MHH5_9EURY|nr:hypothetical protein [Methanocorpusculaceae archaeon Cs1]
MRIQRSVQHKYCADGSFMKEYQLDSPVTEGFFQYLKNFGKVETIPNLGQGFYTFEKPDWFSIKGFVGDTTVEVRFRTQSMDLTSEFLYFLFSSYREGETIDLTVLKRRESSLSERVRKHLYGNS